MTFIDHCNSYAAIRYLPRSGNRFRRPFSLMEIIIVVAIITLALALVMPKVGRLPRRLAVARAISDIRRAFQESGMRAVAGGQSMRLILKPEARQFVVQPVAVKGTRELFAVVSGTNASQSEGNSTAAGTSLFSTTDYEIPENVEWDSTLLEGGEDNSPEFIFHPDGEASGNALEFSVAQRRFRLEVDKLTGVAVITEIDL